MRRIRADARLLLVRDNSKTHLSIRAAINSRLEGWNL
jgi:hypothetical protein